MAQSGAFGLNRHWGLAFAMRRGDVERVDLAALGKCGSRIGLVSARASSACVVPGELAGGPSFKLAAILVTGQRRLSAQEAIWASRCANGHQTRKAASRRDKGAWCGPGGHHARSVVLCAGHEGLYGLSVAL